MMSFLFDVLNSIISLFIFVILVVPGIGIGFLIGEVLGRKYAIISAVVYSVFIPPMLKRLLPLVPWLGEAGK